MALVYLQRRNSAASPGVPGGESRALDLLQPAHAKPRSCTAPTCVQRRQHPDPDLFREQLIPSKQTGSVAGSCPVQGFGKQLAALPATLKPDSQPKSIASRRAPQLPAPGDLSLPQSRVSAWASSGTCREDALQRCPPQTLPPRPDPESPGCLWRTRGHRQQPTGSPRLFGSPQPWLGQAAAPARCRLRVAVAAAEVGAMTQEIMRQIRRRRGAASGRGGEAAASFGPTPASPPPFTQHRSWGAGTHTPGCSDSPGVTAAPGRGDNFSPPRVHPSLLLPGMGVPGAPVPGGEAPGCGDAFGAPSG